MGVGSRWEGPIRVGSLEPASAPHTSGFHCQFSSHSPTVTFTNPQHTTYLAWARRKALRTSLGTSLKCSFLGSIPRDSDLVYSLEIWFSADPSVTLTGIPEVCLEKTLVQWTESSARLVHCTYAEYLPGKDSREPLLTAPTDAQQRSHKQEVLSVPFHSQGN